MSTTTFGIALLGFGTVGQGVYELLSREAAEIESRHGYRFEVRRVLVRDPARARTVALPPGCIASSFDDVLSDPGIDVVVEVMGGEEPARDYIQGALKAGKHVISANKKLFGKDGDRLIKSARAHGRFMGFAGAVTGFHQLCPSILNSVMIRSLVGIFNGTSNYILTQLESGMPFDQALKRAQDLGYAEADPSEDIDGVDVCNKLVIATRLAFGLFPSIAAVPVEGIRDLTHSDLGYAKEFGFTIKLLGVSQLLEDGKLGCVVGPHLVPLDQPLASVRGAENGIQVFDAFRGLQGMIASGAGGEPTAMAIFSDLMRLARGEPILWPTNSVSASGQKVTKHQTPTQYYVRLQLVNRPGVLAQATKAFAKQEINLSEVSQREVKGARDATLVLLTSVTNERAVKNALSEIHGSDLVTGTPLVLPVLPDFVRPAEATRAVLAR